MANLDQTTYAQEAKQELEWAQAQARALKEDSPERVTPGEEFAHDQRSRTESYFKQQAAIVAECKAQNEHFQQIRAAVEEALVNIEYRYHAAQAALDTMQKTARGDDQ